MNFKSVFIIILCAVALNAQGTGIFKVEDNNIFKALGQKIAQDAENDPGLTGRVVALMGGPIATMGGAIAGYLAYKGYQALPTLRSNDQATKEDNGPGFSMLCGSTLAELWYITLLLTSDASDYSWLR